MNLLESDIYTLGNNGLLGVFIELWRKFTEFWSIQTNLCSLLAIIIFLQLAILFSQHRNLTQIKSRAFARGWKSRGEDDKLKKDIITYD